MKQKNVNEAIDIDFLQKFQDMFSKATGMASISVDLEGSITEPSNFTDFCINLTRGSKEGLRRCLECDVKGGEESKRTGKPAVYYCHAGLMDFGVPIMVDGEQVGSVLGGQVLPVKPDEEKFRKIALELGIDPDKYIEALRKIKIVPEDQIRAAAELLFLTVGQVNESRTHFLRLKKSYTHIEEQSDQISKTSSRLNELVSSLTEVDKKLLDFILQMKAVVDMIKQIRDVTKELTSIAERTHLISINASIVSTRFGSATAAFTVICHEIRNLAHDSKQNVLSIEQLIDNITKNISILVKMLEANGAELHNQTGAAKNIAPMLDNILNDLKNFALSFEAA